MVYQSEFELETEMMEQLKSNGFCCKVKNIANH